MKLAESKLKQIIKEEIQKVLLEQDQSMPGGVSDDRVYGMSTGIEGADVTADLKGLTARQTLRKLSKLYGGIKGIRQLSRKDPDRIAYRKAYKAMAAARRRKMPEPELTGRKKARAVEPVPTFDAKRQAAKQRRKEKRAAQVAAAEKRRKEFEKQQAMDQAKVYTEPSTAAGFTGPAAKSKQSSFGTIGDETAGMTPKKKTSKFKNTQRSTAGALTGTPRE